MDEAWTFIHPCFQEESDASVAFVASRFNEDTLFNLFAIQIDTLEMEAGA